MGERVKSKRRIMKEFEISELSSVDRPAQAPARALLMKRADDEDLEKHADHNQKTHGRRDGESGPGAVTEQKIGFRGRKNGRPIDPPLVIIEGPQTRGKAIAEAKAQLEQQGFTHLEQNYYSSKVKKGYDDMPQAASISAINQQVQAVDFDTVLAEQEAREAVSEIGDELREKWYALQRAFNTIAADESVTTSDKITAMQTSMAQYIDSLAEQSDEIAESMTKALTAVPAVAELLAKDDTTEGDEPMTDAEKKQIADLTKNVEELTTKLAAATAAEPAKKSAELQEALTAAQAQGTELTEKAAKSEAEKAEAVIKAGMSDAEKAYADAQDEKGKKEFMGMSPEDRKKKMSKAADDNPVVYKAVDGAEFRKSDDPRLVALAKRNDDLAKSNAEEIEKRENAEFSKQAESEPFTFYKGEVADKVKVVRAVSKIADEGVRKALTEMLEVGGKAIGAAFKSLGHQDENVQKSAADFNKRVSEIASRDKISKSKAMSKARAEFPDEFAAFQASGAPAN